MKSALVGCFALKKVIYSPLKTAIWENVISLHYFVRKHEGCLLQRAADSKMKQNKTEPLRKGIIIA